MTEEAKPMSDVTIHGNCNGRECGNLSAIDALRKQVADLQARALDDEAITFLWLAMLQYMRDVGLGDIHEGCQRDDPKECSLFGLLIEVQAALIVRRRTK